MSRTHTHERAYLERQSDTKHQDALFDGSRWGNQRRMRARMKVKLRREERHRQSHDWQDEAPAFHSLPPNPNRISWRV